MSDVSYELKKTACNPNPYHVLSVTVSALSVIHWEGYSCAKSSGSVYFSRTMRESLISALYGEGCLKIADPEHSSVVDYEYSEGSMTVCIKYFNEGMSRAGEPQSIANGIHEIMVNKMSSAVAKHFEIFAAHQRHINVAKRAMMKESGGDGK